jgi:hypothetical protein
MNVAAPGEPAWGSVAAPGERGGVRGAIAGDGGNTDAAGGL